MNDYAVWRTQALRGSKRRTLSHEPEQARSPPPTLPSMAFASPSSAPSASVVTHPPRADSSSGSDASCAARQARVRDRLAEVLTDIAATERGQERAWLNVQPCVLHTLKLLLSTAQECDGEVRQLRSALERTQACLDLLVQDRAVKEERYRLDVAAHRAEMAAVQMRVRALEAAAAAQQPVTLESRVAALEHAVRQLARHGCPSPLSKPTPRATPLISVLSRPASASSSPSTAASSSSSSSQCSTRPGATAATSPLRPQRHKSRSPVTRQMLEEIHRLRRQWRHFLDTVPQTPGESRARSSQYERAERDGEEDEREESRVRRRPGDRTVHTRDERAGWATGRGNDAPTQHGQNNLTKDGNLARHGEDCIDDEGMCEGATAHGAQQHSAPQPHPLLSPLPLTLRDVTAVVSPSSLPASWRRVRWCALDDGHRRLTRPRRLSPSRATRAISEDGGGGCGRCVHWCECHVFDSRTDSWYTLGGWPAHHTEAQRWGRVDDAALLPGSKDARGDETGCWAGLVSWPHPSQLRVRQGGIYEVRVCLVRLWAHTGGAACPAVVDSGVDATERGRHALALCVDGVPVTGLRECVTQSAVRAEAVASDACPCHTLSRRTPSPPRLCSPCAAPVSTAARSPRSHSARHRGRHTGVAEALSALQRRPCCGPGQLSTHTVTACLYLPPGVTLQVRCREPYVAAAAEEMMCELTHVL